MNELIKYLSGQSRSILTTLSFVAVVLLGVIDHATGPELSFSIFYLLPISLAAWFVGKWPGILISIASAVTWLIADVASGNIYSNPVIPGWNALVRLGFFFVVTHTLASLHQAKVTQEELIHFIVHDLRSPLAVITLGLDGLQRFPHQLTKTQQRLVKSTVVSAQWMSILINSLLDLPRLERGDFPLQLGQINANELVESSLAQMTLWADRADLSLVAEFSGTANMIYADQDITKRVLLNLLSNAIKFSPSESVVKVYVGPARDNMLAISVVDQGPGIPEKWVDKVFEKFVQIEARKGGAAIGSGLGLTFCQLAIKAQGGRISLKNNPDQGTTVTFALPSLMQQPGGARRANVPNVSG